MRTDRGLLVVSVVVVALVASACGSTLSNDEQSVQSSGDELTQGLDAGSLPPGARVNDKGQVVNAEGEVLGSAEDFGISEGSSATGASGSSGNSTSGVSGSTSGSTNAPGVTDKTISLGFIDYEEWAQVCTAVGADCPGLDFQRAWQAIVDDTNKRGGIAGRKVVPRYQVFESNSDDYRREAQEACAAWTQDNPVFAALTNIDTFGGENFLACMERAGAMVVSHNSLNVKFDERVFTRYPHFVAPLAMDLNTQAKTLVDGLVRQRYFTKDAKIGLLIFDQPYWDYATERSLVPALRRHGLKLSSIARVHDPQSTQALGQTASDANSAAFRFKAEGITHVMMLDWGAVAGYFFMQAAEKQAFRPRYGLTGQSFGNWMAENLGSDANNQLRDSRIIGWAPAADVRAGDEPSFVNTRDRKRCLALVREAGVQLEDREAERVVIEMCDAMWIFKAIIESGGGTITGDGFVAGIDRLGSSYIPAAAFATRLSAGIRDGVGAVAPLSYFEKCTCFRYTARPYAIPN